MMIFMVYDNFSFIHMPYLFIIDTRKNITVHIKTIILHCFSCFFNWNCTHWKLCLLIPYWKLEDYERQLPSTSRLLGSNKSGSGGLDMIWEEGSESKEKNDLVPKFSDTHVQKDKGRNIKYDCSLAREGTRMRRPDLSVIRTGVA